MKLRGHIDQFGNSLRKLYTDREKFRIPIYYLLFLCILAISITLFASSIGRPYMGIGLLKDDRVWAVIIEDDNGPASLAGIREGDRPLEINGQPANNFLEKYESAGIVMGRLIKEITTIDDNNQLITVDLKDASVSWQYFTSQFMWFVVCIVFWLTGFYVFFRRPKSMVALLLCFCGLAFGLALSGNMAVERTIPTALWFEITASIIGPWLLLHFFLILPEERAWLRDKSLVYLIYIPATITLILFPIIGYANGQPLPGFRIVRYFECGLVFLAVVGVAIYNYFHTVSIRTRQQMKIVLISCVFALVPLIVLNMLPATMHTQPIIPFGFSILFLVFIPIGMGYAVITKRLMDIDVIIRRGVIYGLITLVMAVIVSVAICLVTIFHSSVGTPVQILTALVLGGVAAVLFGPIKKRVELLIDKLFYKDRYDYRQVIQSLSSALNSVNNLTDISRLTVGIIVNTLNLVGGCLFIRTPSNSFEMMASQGIFNDITKQEHFKTLIPKKDNMIEYPDLATAIDPDITFIVRLVTGEQEVGILYLSHKVSKQSFSADDLYLIQGISSVSSMALHSAMLVRDVSIRDTFVSIASHELRTPLTAIVGYTALLLRRNPPEATRKEWLKTILDNGQSINDMTDDLLNVSRIQSGKIALKLEHLKLSQILDEQVNIARENTDIHKFDVKIEPNLPDVIVDRSKFGQVVANLFSNAIKYSPNGGCITLSSRYDPSQNYIIVSVTDEGIGISAEDKKSLFKTFHRIRRTETQSIRGSGLGLFIAKEWTEAMGGQIWVESELNKGSTFFVSIPIHSEEESLENVP
jgi:signal transduction histidine kinase